MIPTWVATMTATSNNGTSVTGTHEFGTDVKEYECINDWTTTGFAFMDTLTQLTWKRGMSGTYGAICGTPSFSYA